MKKYSRVLKISHDFFAYILFFDQYERRFDIMIVLGIVLGVISIACVVLEYTSTWIDTHDRNNASELKLKAVIMLHIILASPIWVVMILVEKFKQWRINYEVKQRT